MKAYIFALLSFIFLTCDNNTTTRTVREVVRDTLVLKDTINFVDTLIIVDTLFSPSDTLILFDTIYAPNDTIVLRDTILVSEPTDSFASAKQLLESFNQTKLLNYLESIASFNRSSLFHRTAASRAYIKNKLEEFGYTVSIQAFPFTYAGVAHVGHNISVTKTGTTVLPPIVAGAHYDSRTTPMTDTLAPGANDNGSGTAVLLHMAELLASKQIERSIQFVWFDAEEQGLHGSNFYADSLAAASQDLGFMFNMDMVGGYVGMGHSTIVCEEDRNNIRGNDAASRALNNKLVAAVQNFSTLTAVKDRAYFTDYEGFERNGYVILGLYEFNGDGSSHYHQSSDTFANVNQLYFIQSAKAAIGFITSEAKIVTD